MPACTMRIHMFTCGGAACVHVPSEELREECAYPFLHLAALLSQREVPRSVASEGPLQREERALDTARTEQTLYEYYQHHRHLHSKSACMELDDQLSVKVPPQTPLND